MLPCASTVSVEKTTDGISVIRLDRPPTNALSTTVLNDLAHAAEELRNHAPGAVVLWGGPEVFSRGGDAAEFSTMSRDVGRRITEAFHRATTAVAALPCPTYAAIAGIAAGGGLELALSCDFRLATPETQLGQYEINMGLFPGGGGTQRLPRLIGVSRAKALIFSGDLISAQDALQIGLVDGIVEKDSLLADVLSRAGRMASGSVKARADAKAAIDGGIDVPLADGLALESALFVQAIARLTENPS